MHKLYSIKAGGGRRELKLGALHKRGAAYERRHECGASRRRAEDSRECVCDFGGGYPAGHSASGGRESAARHSQWKFYRVGMGLRRMPGDNAYSVGGVRRAGRKRRRTHDRPTANFWRDEPRPELSAGICIPSPRLTREAAL